MRNFTLILLTLLCVFAFNLYANGQNTGGTDVPQQGKTDQPMIDFGNYSPSPGGVDGITDEDMSLNNWRVWQNAAATNVVTQRESWCRGKDKLSCLGVKVSFPYYSYASHAYIEPRYCINPFDKDGKAINTAQGVIRNVGVIKDVSVEVSGRGYKVGLGVRFRNERNEVTEYFLGYLDFIGWKTLKWVNPDYNPRVDPKRVDVHPVYPLHEPYLVFDSFVIHRYDGGYGGDFVTYFKTVKVSYDVAIPESVYKLIETEKDDETWSAHKNLYRARNSALADKIKTMKDWEKSAIERKGTNHQKDSEYPKDEPSSSTTPSTN